MDAFERKRLLDQVEENLADPDLTGLAAATLQQLGEYSRLRVLVDEFFEEPPRLVDVLPYLEGDPDLSEDYVDSALWQLAQQQQRHNPSVAAKAAYRLSRQTEESQALLRDIALHASNTADQLEALLFLEDGSIPDLQGRIRGAIDALKLEIEQGDVDMVYFIVNALTCIGEPGEAEQFEAQFNDSPTTEAIKLQRSEEG